MISNHSSLFNKDCGLLMHPSSLPNRFGIGDFGPSATQWLELLASSGQSLWQILPLNPAGYGDSPYQGLSAFAANPVYLSPEALHAIDLISDYELRVLEIEPNDQVDFTSVYECKAEMVVWAAQRFFEWDTAHPLREKFNRFVHDEGEWLEDFAIYSALKQHHGMRAWTEWPKEFRDRDAVALRHFSVEYAKDINRVRFEQFFLAEQWATVRETAQRFNIRIVGDLPIFVAHDSADVWCQPNLFRLNSDGSPTVVAGVPPDYFSETGQLWGNPLYAWEVHRADGFAWWRKRLRKILDWVDVVRIDHFRGFDACWEIPGDAETAIDGHWIDAPGREVFEKFVEDFGLPLPVIAEDLGVITPEVVALRDDFHLPGIRIEQFAFGSDEMKSTFLPETYGPDCVAYTGTHDNDTVVGWFNSSAGGSTTRSQQEVDAERAETLAYFGTDGSEIHQDFINRLYQSEAGATIVPVQDLLGLGSEARMNTPGVASGSWRWRLTRFDALVTAFEALAVLTKHCQRGSMAGKGAAVNA
ncbi:MAG TPA: 4-alpha-glucanotransferase [Opitutae bacterium]|nr:4-alpha-glucanotransferase [Opitutae bacterium]